MNSQPMYHNVGPGSVGALSQQQNQSQPLPSQQQQNQSPMMMAPGHGNLQQQSSPAMNQMMQSSQPQRPLSNNPPSMMAPNTPQQQLYQPQQHLQPGSIPQCSPYAMSVQSNFSAQNSNAPASQEHTSLATSVLSANPQTQYSTGGTAQQPNTTGSPASAPPPFPTHETDPWAAARRLILFDLRRDTTEWSLAASALAQHKFEEARIGASTTSSGAGGEDVKKIAAPPSNLMNPLSANPHSVNNPMSVNAPNSVKSLNDEKTGGGADTGAGDGASLSPEEHYANCRDKLMNTYDAIELYLTTSNEACRQMMRLEAASSYRLPSDVASRDMPELQQPYAEAVERDKRSIQSGIDYNNGLRAKLHHTIVPKSGTLSVPNLSAVGEFIRF